MNSQFIFQIKKIEDEFHTILTLKDLHVSIETFFNELQQLKHNLNSKISIDFTTKAGKGLFFNSEGILRPGIGREVKIDYSWVDAKNKLCNSYMLFFADPHIL